MRILAWSHTEPQPSSCTGACPTILSAGESVGFVLRWEHGLISNPWKTTQHWVQLSTATKCALCPGAESPARIQGGDRAVPASLYLLSRIPDR